MSTVSNYLYRRLAVAGLFLALARLPAQAQFQMVPVGGPGEGLQTNAPYAFIIINSNFASAYYMLQHIGAAQIDQGTLANARLPGYLGTWSGIAPATKADASGNLATVAAWDANAMYRIGRWTLVDPTNYVAMDPNTYWVSRINLHIYADGQAAADNLTAWAFEGPATWQGNNLNASKLTSGTVPTARLPGILPALSILNAANLVAVAGWPDYVMDKLRNQWGLLDRTNFVEMTKDMNVLWHVNFGPSPNVEQLAANIGGWAGYSPITYATDYLYPTWVLPDVQASTNALTAAHIKSGTLSSTLLPYNLQLWNGYTPASYYQNNVLADIRDATNHIDAAKITTGIISRDRISAHDSLPGSLYYWSLIYTDDKQDAKHQISTAPANTVTPAGWVSIQLSDNSAAKLPYYK